MSTQTEAQRLADAFKDGECFAQDEFTEAAAAELLRQEALIAELAGALRLMDEAYCSDDYGTKEGRAKGRAALIACRAALAKVTQ